MPIETVLGSCIGVVLVWRRARVFGMAHVVLPQRIDPTDHRRARFADTAVPWLLQGMGVPGDQRRDVVAVIAGGSSLYGNTVHHVGHCNDQAVGQALQAHGIRVVGRDIGGDVPRRLVVNTTAGIAESSHLHADDRFTIEHRWRLVPPRTPSNRA